MFVTIESVNLLHRVAAYRHSNRDDKPDAKFVGHFSSEFYLLVVLVDDRDRLVGWCVPACHQVIMATGTMLKVTSPPIKLSIERRNYAVRLVSLGWFGFTLLIK